MQDLERAGREAEKREVATRQKVCLVLNKKKEMIKELKERLQILEKDGGGVAAVVAKKAHPEKRAEEEEKDDIQ
jgi:anion-transporting  ArsA/GET3 family ATPase